MHICNRYYRNVNANVQERDDVENYAGEIRN